MAPAVSQPDATLATDRPPPERFSQVRTALIRALRSSPEAREPLCDALEQLEAIQQELEDYKRALPQPAQAGANTNGGHRRAKTQEYEVQVTPDGSFLTERRSGDSQPFRCPRSTYDAAAEVLAGVGAEALPFEDLMDRLNRQTGQRQPDYRLRVVLRFWMRHGVVLRTRTKYRPGEPSAFLNVSRSLWTSLESRHG